MNYRGPLWDFHGRTLGLNRDVNEVVDGLLRMQNAKNHHQPITLYVMGSPAVPPALSTDALMLCSVIRALRSPVITIGMGLLASTQILVLAAGTHRRCLLRHTVLALAPFQWHSLPGARTRLGLSPGQSLESPHALLDAQLAELLNELKLDPALFAIEELLTADQAVDRRLVDEVVVSTNPRRTGERKIKNEPQR